jgi:hypothetical protein
MYIISISTELCLTPAEGINAYFQKYAYKYTYFCICCFFIVGSFGNQLYFEGIVYSTRFIAYQITKIMFNSLIILFFPSPLSSYISTHYLICRFHNKYTTHVQSVHIKITKFHQTVSFILTTTLTKNFMSYIILVSEADVTLRVTVLLLSYCCAHCGA